MQEMNVCWLFYLVGATGLFAANIGPKHLFKYFTKSQGLNDTLNATVVPETSMMLGTSASHEKDIYWEVFQFSSNILLFLIGVLGNFMITMTIIQHKTMQNLQNYFVFSLAITDLVTLVVILPLNLMQKYVSWPFGEFTCKYVLPIADVLPAVSILMLVAISIDRYRAIIFALSRAPSLQLGFGLIIMIWIASYLIVGLPLTFTFRVGQGFWVSKSCYTVWSNSYHEQVYGISRTILFYIIPSVIIFFCFIRVNETLGNNMKFLARSVSGFARVIRLKRQKRVMNMFFAIFLTFVICFFPINMTYTIYLLHNDIAYWKYFGEWFQLTTIFGLTNSVCNPIILYKLSRAYRDNFRKYLPCLNRFSTSNQYDNDPVADDDADENVPENVHWLRQLARRRGTKESHVSLLATSPKLASSPLVNNHIIKEVMVPKDEISHDKESKNDALLSSSPINGSSPGESISPRSDRRYLTVD